MSRDAPLRRAAGPCPLRPRAGLALAAGAALAALIYDPAAPAAAPKIAALSLLSLLAVVASLKERERTVAAAWPTTLWLALCAWSALSLSWGDHTAGGLPRLAAWCAAGGVMLVLHRVEQPLRVELARWLALVVGCVAAGAALLQWLLGARGIGVHGGQGNPNWLGLLLAVTLPISVGVLSRKRLVLLAPIVIQLGGLVLSGSRVAWLALAAVGVAAAVFHTGGRRRLRWLALAGAALGLLLVIVAAARSGTPLHEAWRGRVQIWRCSARGALASAPLGAGVGGFGHAFLDAQGEVLATSSPGDAARRFENAATAHNDYLHVAVETGPVGALLLALALALALASGVRRWPAGAWALLALALTALGDSPLHQPAVLVVIAAVFPALGSSGTATVSRALSGRPARVVVLALVAVLLAPAMARWMGRRLAAPARGAVLDRRLAVLEQASRVDPWSGALALELGLARLELGQADRALVELERSRRLLANVGTHVAMGSALLRLGRVKPAIEAYRRAIAWHPGLFRAHANLAEALRRRGELDEAARHLRVARSLFPGHARLPALERRLRRSRIDQESNGISGD